MDIHISEAEKRVLSLLSETTGVVVQQLEYLNNTLQQKDKDIQIATERYLEAEKKASEQSTMIENLTEEIKKRNNTISQLERSSNEND